MITLRIEHSVSDFAVWTGAFDRFSAVREQAGMRHYRISRPVDDPAFVMLDLDFDQASAAEAFLAVLQRDVWGSEQASPALVGSPLARIIETVRSEAY